MCQLLETIKIDHGHISHLNYHQQRVNRSRKELWPNAPSIELASHIKIPKDCEKGIFRCRIIYGLEIEEIKYIKQNQRQFNSLKCIYSNTIDYHLKFADRSALNLLLEQKDSCDEIIIVKNNLITDCSIGNLVFFDGKKWLTPINPLLKGTQRQFLIETGKLTEIPIRLYDLNYYSIAGIINAFFDLNNMPRIPLNSVIL